MQNIINLPDFRLNFTATVFHWKVNGLVLTFQKELQRESQLSCGYRGTGMAWGDWWKHFPQYRWPKFRASRQGTGNCSLTCLYFSNHQSVIAELLKSWNIILRTEMDEYVIRQMIDSFFFFLSQNTFVGLTNLGATCYVNTFLQVWFHNLELRRSLYQCHNSRAQ